MEIEVGEYVRTKNGVIGKLEKQYVFGHGVNYPEPQEWILATNGNHQEVIVECTDYPVKHSHNIIDLIEEGDYVNGKYVYSVGTAIGNLPIVNHTDGTFTPQNMIKSIVTKEQFTQRCYKVEGE